MVYYIAINKWATLTIGNCKSPQEGESVEFFWIQGKYNVFYWLVGPFIGLRRVSELEFRFTDLLCQNMGHKTWPQTISVALVKSQGCVFDRSSQNSRERGTF